MTDQEKVHFLEVMIRNIGDQLGVNMADFGHNEKSYLEEGKETFYKIIQEISRLQKSEE